MAFLPALPLIGQLRWGRNVESLNKTLHIGAQGSLTAVN